MSHQNLLHRSRAWICVLALAAAPALSQGQGVKIDGSTPIKELQGYASAGNAEAMQELAGRYLEGTGTRVDTSKGVSLLGKAAGAGRHQAWYTLGVAYANGIGVKANMPKALECFRKGAAAGNSDCQCSLGMFYQAGERIPGGVKEDAVEARKYYRMAAEQGHQEAILHLGQLLVFGKGGEPDPVEGAKWFRKGAELGSAEAQWSLGMCYLQGKGTELDSVQAYGLFSAAAAGAVEAGQKEGMEKERDNLGSMLSAAQLKEGTRQAELWKRKGLKTGENRGLPEGFCPLPEGLFGCITYGFSVT
jgi:TPR repeat protein